MKKVAAQLRSEAAAFVVLAIGIAATIAVYLYVDRAVALQARARFDALASTALADIRDRTESYLAALRATRGLFAAGGEPSRDEFHAFVSRLELDRYYAGIQGIGYARVLRPEELPQHERRIRAEGFPEYRVWPPGPRSTYAPIVYIEPFDPRNRRAFGFDMMSEPTRREAMMRARGTGAAACSGRVELVQETGDERQAGFLIYLPVYLPEDGRGSTHPAGGADRAAARDRFLGFVYAPFRAGDLLRATLSTDLLSSLVIGVYDGDRMATGDLLFASRREAAGAGPRRVAHIEVAGRLWTIDLAAGAGFEPRWSSWLPRGVLLLGAFLSLLLFGVTQQEVRSRAEAQRAARRERFLADSGKLLASSLDYRSTLAGVAARAARDEVDWCVVLLIEPEGPVRLVGHREEAVARDAAERMVGLVLDPEGRFGAAAALARGEPFVANRIDDAALRRIAATPEQLERLRAEKLQAVMTIPLRARGEALGALTFASCDAARQFGAADVTMGEDLGRLAVAAIDTARLYRRAQDAVRIRDEFLSIASHELRTPLTSLALQADSLVMAGSRGRVPEPIGRKAEVIRRNVDRLSRLIGNLLDISRISSGRLDLFIEEVDLREVVEDVVARFDDELARAGCHLRMNADGPAIGRWDRLRLDQVVTNLVSNAVKYGRGRPVTIELRAHDDRVALSVRDEGIGIPREAQERIFERFERAVTDRHYGGFGLGLWIVRRIVDALGGTIVVESTPGQGATFTVELGREAAEASVPKQEPTTTRHDVC